MEPRGWRWPMPCSPGRTWDRRSRRVSSSRAPLPTSTEHASDIQNPPRDAGRRERGGHVMSDALRVVYLARHGQTAWTISGQHTGLTDLPLTTQGELEAVRLGRRLEKLTFAGVLTSPLRRAVRTCELAGFGPAAVVEPDLAEWNYGAYEGRTSVDIRAERPDWQLFRDGCPAGESPAQVGARADRGVRRGRDVGGGGAAFSGGPFLRVFAARWLGLDPGAGRYFVLGTASLSAVGYEHDRSEPAIRLWDEMSHEREEPRQ